MTTMNRNPGLRDFTADLFAPYQGQVFRFRCPDGRGGIKDVELELLEVTRRRPRGRPDTIREPFALLFRSVKGETIPVVRSALPELAHEDFAADPMFLSRVQVSIGARDDEVYYEAIFN